MSEFIENYKKENWKEAQIIAEEYSDRKITSVEQLEDLVSDLMIAYGPDRHCDGSEIISQVIWNLLSINKE